jgi:hypothetical protein
MTEAVNVIRDERRPTMRKTRVWPCVGTIIAAILLASMSTARAQMGNMNMGPTVGGANPQARQPTGT